MLLASVLDGRGRVCGLSLISVLFALMPLVFACPSHPVRIAVVYDEAPTIRAPPFRPSNATT